MSRSLRDLTLKRQKQNRLELCLALGDVAAVCSRAVVVGVFQSVTPGGAARALDRYLHGVIDEFTHRRMFSARVGEIFSIASTRSRLRTEQVVLVGLGAFDEFSANTAGLVAENVVRFLMHSHIDEFAMVLFGAGTLGEDQLALQQYLRELLAGCIRGHVDTHHRNRLLRLTLCEDQPERFALLKEDLFQLVRDELFDDIEVSFDEITLSPSEGVVEGHRINDAMYLMVRDETVYLDGKLQHQFRLSVLTAGDKATVRTDVQLYEPEALVSLLREISARQDSFQSLKELGQRLASMILPESTSAQLQTMPQRHLVLVHDKPASRIPWEMLPIGDWYPALGEGLTRKYQASDIPVAKWLEQRQRRKLFQVLLIIDPNENLLEAQREGDEIRTLLARFPEVRITEFRGKNATKQQLLHAFRSGRYDILHYAGHAVFDPNKSHRSGIICAGEETLSGEDLSQIEHLPGLVFFNACEAGRLRNHVHAFDEPIRQSASIAEAFLRGGAANYLGTYWPVGDQSARLFAQAFYQKLFEEADIADAVLAGRKKLYEEELADWIDYMFYGSYGFKLKVGSGLT